jgi:hypothetical protein
LEDSTASGTAASAGIKATSGTDQAEVSVDVSTAGVTSITLDADTITTAAGYAPAADQDVARFTDVVSRVTSLPAINMRVDSGRYSNDTGAISTHVGSYAATDMKAYNGAAFSEGGKFIYNNNNNGGTRGTMNQDTVDLLAAMGRTASNDKRYGVEFYIINATAGSGTAGNIGSNYLVISTSGHVGMGNTIHLEYWVRAKSGGSVDPIINLYHSGSINYAVIDGVKQTVGSSGDMYTLVRNSTSAGWHHVALQYTAKRGYWSSIFALYATSGAILQIACPFELNGAIPAEAVVKHASPLSSI